MPAACYWKLLGMKNLAKPGTSLGRLAVEFVRPEGK
jgi:hypothetical protein